MYDFFFKKLKRERYVSLPPNGLMRLLYQIINVKKES
jgi:hypothetical protein